MSVYEALQLVADYLGLIVMLITLVLISQQKK